MTVTPILRAAAASTIPPATTRDRRCRHRPFAPATRRSSPRLRVPYRPSLGRAVTSALVTICSIVTIRLAEYVARGRARVRGSRSACRGDRGQATTEYALILLAAALVGLMVVAWATAGGGAARISRLFNGVIDAVIDKV